jgi:hypothetical protein
VITSVGEIPPLPSGTRDMPQPLRGKNIIVTQGPGKILERPELAAQLANVVSDWRNVEEILEFIYSKILRSSTNSQSHGVTDIVSGQIFESIYTLDAKLKLIDSAFKTFYHPTHETFIKLCPDIRNRGRDRNKLVHNTWGICEAYPDALILTSFNGSMIYKLKDFVDMSTRTQVLAEKLLALLEKLPDSLPKRLGG